MDRQELLGEIGRRWFKAGVGSYRSEARGEARAGSDIGVLAPWVSSARGARCRP
jgi:hypothetical protein